MTTWNDNIDNMVWQHGIKFGTGYTAWNENMK